MAEAAKKHIIQKLSIEINIDGEHKDRATWDNSVDLVKENILSALENILDELDDGQVIRIDQLNLELDQIDPKHLKKELLLKIRKEFPEQIQNAIQEKAIIQKESSPFDSLEYFLASGTLPWWDKSNTLASIEESILKLLSSDAKNDKSRIRAIFSQSNPERMVLQLSDQFLETTISLLGFSEDIWSALKTYQTLLTEYFSPRLIRNHFIKVLLEKLQKETNSKLTEKEIFINVLKRLHSEASPSLQKELADFVIPTQKKRQKTHRIIQEWQSTLKSAAKIKADKEPAQSKEKHTNNNLETDNEIYVPNAGLILLHPFIVYLFQALEYTQADKFVDNFQQQQAALALQYLLEPNDQFPEHDLALNKLLCGIPQQQPIESKLILNESIRTQTEQLLQSTIKHWSALKTTSIDGLRHNFLIREGKLSRKVDGDWKLFVPYQTQDVLLAKLNWNYSMVKLPWMDNILWVDWG